MTESWLVLTSDDSTHQQFCIDQISYFTPIQDGIKNYLGQETYIFTLLTISFIGTCNTLRTGCVPVEALVASTEPLAPWLVPAIASSAKLGAGGAAVLPFQWGRQLPLLKSDASSDDDTGSSSSDSSRLIASGVWKSFWFFASSELGIGGSLLKTSTFCCRNQQNQVRI